MASDTIAHDLARQMAQSPVKFAKMYGRGELDPAFECLHDIPDCLKHELYAAKRRWHAHQIYKTSETRKFLETSAPLVPSIEAEGNGQT